MNVLLTGASGFIGRNFVREFSQSGIQGLASSRTPLIDLPPLWTHRYRDEILAGAPQESRLDLVLHLEVKQHAQNPTAADLADFQAVNVEGTRQWLDWCRRHGVKRFVYFSSIKAVGESSQCQDETARGLPSTSYGESKRAAETLVREWAAEDSGHSAFILRPAVVYGPGNQANMYSFVKAIDAGRFFLVGANDNIKSLISSQNLIAATLHLLGRMNPGVEVYNMVDQESYTVSQLGEMIAGLLGKRWKARALPLAFAKTIALVGDLGTRVTHQSFPLTSARLSALLETTHFSCQKLRNTGFVHPQTTKEGLAEMVEWYRAGKGRA